MLTPKPCQSGLDLPPSTASRADTHSQLAIEQAALHSARLALARWRSGSAFPQRQVDAALRPSVQAAWYAETQKNFQRWLEGGGFSQAGPAVLPRAKACVG
ncbi:MAG TPA: hypothetical protein VFG03_18390 [Telluria sp.]|nr:hypothetical protein [Telluria sp.]